MPSISNSVPAPSQKVLAHELGYHTCVDVSIYDLIATITDWHIAALQRRELIMNQRAPDIEEIEEMLNSGKVTHSKGTRVGCAAIEPSSALPAAQDALSDGQILLLVNGRVYHSTDTVSLEPSSEIVMLRRSLIGQNLP